MRTKQGAPNSARAGCVSEGCMEQKIFELSLATWPGGQKNRIGDGESLPTREQLGHRYQKTKSVVWKSPMCRFIQQEAGALGEKAGNSGDQHSGDETTQPSPSFPASAAREKFSPCCFDVRGADILPACGESSPRTWQTTGLRKHCLSDSNFQ